MSELAMAETDVARGIAAELARCGWELYHEVSMGFGQHRADLVATRGRLLIVIETKVAMSLALLGQAMRWSQQCHAVLLGTARGKPSQKWRNSELIFWLCKTHGWGWWTVDARGEVEVRQGLQLRRGRHVDWVRKHLAEEQRDTTYAEGGTNGGGYWTPFNSTRRELLSLVKQSPGIELRQAIAAMRHHYASDASARSTIPLLIRKGVIPLRAEGRPLRLYLPEVVGE